MNLKNLGLFFMIIAILITLSCKDSSESPEPIEYAENVKVVYHRDPAMITRPSGNDAFTVFYVVTKSGTDMQYERAEQIGEHAFQATFPSIRKNYELVWYVSDCKLLDDALNECSTWTAKGLTIENGEIIEIYPAACVNPKSN